MEYRLDGSYRAVIYILRAVTAWSVAPIWTDVSTTFLVLSSTSSSSSIETEKPAGFIRHRAPEEEVTLRETLASDRISGPLLTRVILGARRDIVISRLAPIPHVCDFRVRACGGAHAKNTNLCVSPSSLA